MFEILILLIFPGAMALAAASDLITMTISNWISITLVVSFAVLALWAGMGWGMIGSHMLVGGVALTIGITCFAMGWIGGGDAKLFAASALWLGWPVTFEYAIYGAVFGGALTLVLFGLGKFPLPQFLNRHRWIARLHSLEDGIPYGLALAAAGLAAYPHSFWMTNIPG